MENWLGYQGHLQCTSARKPTNHEITGLLPRETAVKCLHGSAMQEFAIICIDNGKLPWPDFRARHPTLVSIRMKSIFMKQNTHCADEHLKQMNSLKFKLSRYRCINVCHHSVCFV